MVKQPPSCPLTIFEPALGIVRRALLHPAQIQSGDVDVVAFLLVPNHDLFRTLDALGLVFLAPYRRLWRREGRRRC